MTPSTPRAALIAGGVDPTGGAGLARDLAMLSRFGVRGAPLVTALTVQNERGVQRVEAVDPELLRAMGEAALEALGPQLAVVKVGLVSHRGVADVLAALVAASRCPLVLDPIVWAGTGDRLQVETPDQVLAPLIERATLWLPNIDEAQQFAGLRWDGSRSGLLAIARRLAGPQRTAAISGGHAEGKIVPMAIAGPSGEEWCEVSRVECGATHGTGCALASTAAAYIASGLPPHAAAAAAHRYVAAALAATPSLPGLRRTPEPI